MVYFQGHPAVRPELDLVEEKYSHDISIDDEINPETSLGKLANTHGSIEISCFLVLVKPLLILKSLSIYSLLVADVFKPDPDFIENEKKYEGLKKELLGDDESDDEDGSDVVQRIMMRMKMSLMKKMKNR